jgi:O-antigen ligase
MDSRADAATGRETVSEAAARSDAEVPRPGGALEVLPRRRVSLSRPRRVLVVALLPAALMLLFLILTFSRQSWVATFFMFPTLLILGASERSVSLRLAGLALIGALILTLLIASLPAAYITSRFLSIFDLTETSTVARFATWREGVDAVERFPFLGTGVGNFFTAISAPGPGAYTHNAYLDVWAETGPVGLIGFLLLLVWAWRSAARIFVEAREPILRGFGLAALGSLSWLCVLFVFDDMLYSARSGPAIWLELGLLVAARRMLLLDGAVESGSSAVRV